MKRPEKELKRFAKVELPPGETQSVSILLGFRSFAYYHPSYKQWITEDGDFGLLIGASSADIRCHLTIMLKSTLTVPCVLDVLSTMSEWLANPRGNAFPGPYYLQVEAEARKRFGGDGEDRYGNESGIGIDVIDMLNDIPLVSVLMFHKNVRSLHPEDMLADLL